MVYTIERTQRSGHGNFKERLIIKTFKDSDSYGRFMSGPNNDFNQWRDSTKNLKAGTYAFAGGQWHNVKSLDASVLAHV